MSFVRDKKFYIALLGFEVIASFLFYLSIINVHWFFWCGIAVFSCLLYFSNMGRFPFIAKGQIGSKIAYFAAGLMPLWSISLMGNSFVYPFWYPTEHRFWCFLPLVILGIINIRLSAQSKV
jgi:hypothetical protein